MSVPLPGPSVRTKRTVRVGQVCDGCVCDGCGWAAKATGHSASAARMPQHRNRNGPYAWRMDSSLRLLRDAEIFGVLGNERALGFDRLGELLRPAGSEKLRGGVQPVLDDGIAFHHLLDIGGDLLAQRHRHG